MDFQMSEDSSHISLELSRVWLHISWEFFSKGRWQCKYKEKKFQAGPLVGLEAQMIFNAFILAHPERFTKDTTAKKSPECQLEISRKAHWKPNNTPREEWGVGGQEVLLAVVSPAELTASGIAPATFHSEDPGKRTLITIQVGLNISKRWLMERNVSKKGKLANYKNVYSV